MKDQVQVTPPVLGAQHQLPGVVAFKLALSFAILILMPQPLLYAQECSGNPTFTCSSGGPSCVNGSWSCACGGTECAIPPSQYTCSGNPNGYPECTSSGWYCQPGPSPIIVDTTGKGFHLTSANQGVIFDMAGNGYGIKMSWTSGGSGNAFLALDRNGNGKIDSGKELFGNYTPQPPSDHPNGYLALAEFDKPEHGGNADGIIDQRDAVFSSLLLWIDENHDGISQPYELYSLPELGVYSISLHYRDDQHYFDQYGNWFHYQAVLNPDPQDGKSKDGRLTYDVFFAVSHNYPSTIPGLSGAKSDSLAGERNLTADLALGSSRSGCKNRR